VLRHCRELYSSFSLTSVQDGCSGLGHHLAPASEAAAGEFPSQLKHSSSWGWKYMRASAAKKGSSEADNYCSTGALCRSAGWALAGAGWGCLSGSCSG